MPIDTPEAFLKVLEKSRLLTPEQLADAKDTTLLTADLDQLCEILIDQGLITGWQADELLQGHTSFFLANYILLDLLGRGGMGGVYLARHRTMNREVALKIVSKKMGKDPESIERFLTEGRASASLDHPNIVRAYDVGSESNRFYIVMEYVPGEDLEEIVELDGPLDFEFAVDCIRQAADGLAHAHQKNLVHCDIKPSNLLVTDQGVVKILDMGMARPLNAGEDSDAIRHDARVLGTVDYMAPEQAMEGPDFDQRADIYSLGCTLYFLLAGQPPFAEGSLAQRIVKHQTEEPLPLKQLRPDIPADLAAICAKMMAKNPDARFQTAQQVSAVLAKWSPPPPPQVAPSSNSAAQGSPSDSTATIDLRAASLSNAQAGPTVLIPTKKNGSRKPTFVFWIAGVALVVVFVLIVTMIVQLLRSPVTTSQSNGPPTPPGAPSPAVPGTEKTPPKTPSVEQPEKKPPKTLPVDQPPPDKQPPRIKPPNNNAQLELPSNNTNKAQKQPTKKHTKKPPKPPRRPPNPFRKMDRAVDLPEFNRQGGAGDQQAVSLGPVLSTSKAGCQLALLGGSSVLVGEQKFTLESNPDGAAWDLRYVGADNQKADVARLWFDKQVLMFQWLDLQRSVPRDHLRFCALRLTADGKKKQLNLAKTRLVDPIVVDLIGNTSRQSTLTEYPPQPEGLRWKVTGIRGMKTKPVYTPGTTVTANERMDIVLTGDAPGQILLRVEYRATPRATDLELGAYYQLAGDTVPTRISVASVQALNRRLTQLVDNEKSLTAKLKKSGRGEEGVQGLRLAAMRRQLDEIRDLLRSAQAIHGKAKIHFREYLSADGAEIELVKTK
ncbi:MAG: serine/threonine protein kinase [Pirellulales bacterium]|nr:serine/threonine protein kinase [Pirellulales bacterium]